MNPFIELARDPVATLGIVAYILFLITLLIWTLGLCYLNVIHPHHHWHDKRPREWEYVPPLGFIARVSAIPLILAIDALAVAALIWMVA